jgi:hypothetical protein
VATYLYCLLRAASEPPSEALTGIAGERVRRVVTGRVAAWVGTIDGEVTRSVDTARRHDAVIRAALRTGATPLPARAGQRFADDAACLKELTRREAAIGRALERVAGCVEMTVHIAASRPAGRNEAGAGPGREYLEALRSRHMVERGVQDGLDGIRARLAMSDDAIIRGEIVQRNEAEGTVLVSHLVSREGVAHYRQAVGAMATEGRVNVVRMAGPFAPYSFSEIGHE